MGQLCQWPPTRLITEEEMERMQEPENWGGGSMKYCPLDMMGYCSYELTAAVISCSRLVQDQINQNPTIGGEKIVRRSSGLALP